MVRLPDIEPDKPYIVTWPESETRGRLLWGDRIIYKEPGLRARATPLIPVDATQRAELDTALAACTAAAEGDSNDDEIEALGMALDIALAMLGIDRDD